MLAVVQMTMQINESQVKARAPLLGCVADDFTGATDLAGILVLNGMRTIVTFGIPDADREIDADAMVIALKSRSIPAEVAVDMSRNALRWLRNVGCRRYFFKYCSTFDSTPKGNIGPVTEALMDELGADFSIACPAFPANRRTIYNGYLFVNGIPLAESGMRNHPLNPMTDSNLVRLLQAQTTRKVGLIDYEAVQGGDTSIANAIANLRSSGVGLAIVDAISEAHLLSIASASRDIPLLTGASGLAIGIPEVFRKEGLLQPISNAGKLPHVSGLSAIISGSCSEATRRQVAWIQQKVPTFHINPLQAVTDARLAHKAAQWALAKMSEGPVLISSTAAPDDVKAAQEKIGVEKAGRLIEDLLAEVTLQLVSNGARRLIVAGGETSGAVLNALGIHSIQIGPQIDPGVNWAVSDGKIPLALALKSGNFGSDDMFAKAWSLL